MIDASNSVGPSPDYPSRLWRYVLGLAVFLLASLGSPVAMAQVPSAPYIQTPSNITEDGIAISWLAPSTGVPTGYDVQRCSGTGCSNFVSLGTVGASTLYYGDTTLRPSTTYQYRVRANSASGYGAFSITVSGTTAAFVPPVSLTAQPWSGTSAYLSWILSTSLGTTNYLIERCKGSSCSNFSQVDNTTTQPRITPGLSPQTTYSFRLRAIDAAGNFSAYTNTVTLTTPATDTQPPTAPTNVVATGVSTTQINVTWNFATDNVAVANYYVDRCTGAACTNFTNIGFGNQYAAIWSDVGLAASTTYRYRVHAVDGTGNVGPYSSIVTASTLTPDTQPPSAPTNVTATAASSTQINLSWTASTDNVGVTGYRIESCAGVGCSTFAQIATTTTAITYSNTGLVASTSYSYRIRATDAAGNLSAYSTVATIATQPPPDTQPPTAPTSPLASAISTSQINVSWTASTDNVGVTGYRVERCAGASCTSFAQIATPVTTGYSDTGLSASTSYSYRIRATDAVGNLSPYSTTVSASTPAPDTQPPTTPTNPAAAGTSTSQINVSWSASTDNVAVTGYLVERCPGLNCINFVQVAAPTATSYSDTGLPASTSYSYRVRATDAAGNLSGYSNAVSATTQAPPDTQPPTPPTALIATAASGTQINLTWAASTDNVGVTSYMVERCGGTGCSSFAQIGTSATTSYSDSGLTSGTAYTYRIRATDAAGNLSGYSNLASATAGSGTATYTYDATGHLSTVTTSSGTTVHYTYDAAGNILSIQVTP